MWTRLDADLDHLERTQCNVSKEFRTRACCSPHEPSLLNRVLLANRRGLEVLEDFVESELNHSLDVLANAGRKPSFDKSPHALGGADLPEAMEEVALLACVGLHVAFDHVERSDQSVGDSAAECTSHETLQLLAVCVWDRV